MSDNDLLHEKVRVYEEVLNELHWARAVSMNSMRVQQLLDAVSRWSYYPRAGDAELDGPMVDERAMLGILQDIVQRRPLR